MIPSNHKITLPDITLIGIHGFAHSGKDSIATYIQKCVGDSYIHPFAHFLKAACIEAFGITADDFNLTKNKERLNEYWNVTPRKIAQFFGTEMFREKLKELIPELDGDFWIRRLVGHINGDLSIPEGWGEYDSGDTIIIPDVRFQNEYDFILGNGGHVIHVVRPNEIDLVGISGHKSEQGILTPDAWKISNHGTLEELYLEVDKFLAHHSLVMSSDKF